MSDRLALRVLSEEDVELIHGVALEMLGEDAVAAEQAAVDAPDTVVLSGRGPAGDLVLDGTRSCLATGGPSGLVLPSAHGRVRRATGVDLSLACRLADALPEVDAIAGPPLRTEDLTPCAEVQSCLQNTSKHVHLHGPASAPMARAVIRMAAVLAGGDADRSDRPAISFSGSPDGLDAALVFARAGLPVGLVLAHALPAAPAPFDLGTALARHHAAVLHGCLSVQRHAPGAPFLYVIRLGAEDENMAASEVALFTLAATQLAARVRLPAIAAAMVTGAEEIGWRACRDNALTSLAVMSARGGLVTGAGTLNRGRVHSPQALVMDAELFSWNARLAAGIPIDEETLALDEIRSVGIGGNYLGRRHTRAHMQNVWRPRLLDRSPWDAWVEAGEEGAPEKAERLVGELLEAHEAMPLERHARESLTRIVAESGL